MVWSGASSGYPALAVPSRRLSLLRTARPTRSSPAARTEAITLAAGQPFTRSQKTAHGSHVSRKRRQRTPPAKRRGGAGSAVVDWVSRNGPKTDAVFTTCRAAGFIPSPSLVDRAETLHRRQ